MGLDLSVGTLIMSGNTDSTKAALDKVDDKWQAWSQHFVGVILQSGAQHSNRQAMHDII